MCLISLFYGNLFSVKFAIFKSFCLKDIMLGITDEEDLFINHILLIAKKHIFWCRCIKVKPSIITFKAQVKKIYQLETSIAKSCNKWPI